MLVTAATELKFHDWQADKCLDAFDLSTPNEIISLSWSSDNKFIIAVQDAGKPEIISLKDMDNIKLIHIVTAVEHATSVLFQRKTKKTVAIGTMRGGVVLYDTTKKVVGKIFRLATPVVCLDFNVNDELLAIACLNGIILVLNVESSLEVCKFNVTSMPTCVSFHYKDEKLLAAGTYTGAIFVFDTKQKDVIYKTDCHSACVNGILFTQAQDKNLVSVSADGRMCVHDYKKKEKECVVASDYPMSSIDMTSDGKHVAVGCGKGIVYIFETNNYLVPLHQWKAHESKITHLRFARNFNDEMSELSCPESTSSFALTSMESLPEDEFKSLYGTVINTPYDVLSLKEFKQDVALISKEESNQLVLMMNAHMTNLLDFMKREFDRMGEQEDANWEMLNLVVAGNPDVLQSTLEEVDNQPIVRRPGDDMPIILE